MYDALEAVLKKYLDEKLIVISEQSALSDKQESDTEEEGEKPLVIAVSPSSDKLKQLKTLLGSRYKGVFVKDMESAEKYLAKSREKS